MKDLLSLFIAVTPSLACVFAATFLAANGIDGWGWFLVVGILVSVSKFKVS